MARLSLFLTVLACGAGASAQSAIPPQSPIYTLNIAVPSNIQTCTPALFSYSASPTLNTSAQVLLSVSIESSDGSFSMLLTRDAQLGEGSWLWNQVNVSQGQYRLTMSSADPDQYLINGQSNPFLVALADTSCLPTASGGATSNSVTNTASTSTKVPPTQSNTPPPTSSTNPASHSSSHSSSSSSSSSSNSAITPGNLSASHTSTGLKAGVAVAVIAVVLSAAGALYWLLVNRRRRSHRAGYDPGYGNLGSRDDQLDSKVPADPLGRTFSGGLAAGGAVNSYSHSGLLDEKSTSAIGGSSNGATAGHSGLDSFSAVGHAPVSGPPQWQYPSTVPVAIVARSTSASTGTTGEGTFTSEHEPYSTHPYAAVQTPKRATRKPVPAYTGDVPMTRTSQERKKRTSANSMSNPSYASSINELPAQPTRTAPTTTATNTLNHKGSFGDSKPMNHVLMPDMPLSQE